MEQSKINSDLPLRIIITLYYLVSLTNLMNMILNRVVTFLVAHRPSQYYSLYPHPNNISRENRLRSPLFRRNIACIGNRYPARITTVLLAYSSVIGHWLHPFRSWPFLIRVLRSSVPPLAGACFFFTNSFASSTCEHTNLTTQKKTS